MRSVVLHEVSKFYDSVPVVNGVSLRVADGEFVTLLGPSGCGKTTTLRMIAGLAAPDLGRIEVGGSDVTHTPIHHRNIGMVFQSHALFPHMTIAENVGFGLKMRGVGHAERTGRILKRSNSLVSTISNRGFQANCRAGNSSGSPLPARWSSTLRFCCSTNRSGRSIASSGKSCRGSCAN